MDLPQFQFDALDGVRVDPVGTARIVIVLLHGYSMDTDSLAPLAQAMGLPAVLYVPRGLMAAPAAGRSWWHVDAARREAQLSDGPRELSGEYPVGRESPRRLLREFCDSLRHLHRGLPLIVAGFSQGGMLACEAVVLGQLQVSGLVLLSSSRLALDEWLPHLSAVEGLPVLVAHGTRDRELSLAAGESLRDMLIAGGARVTWLAFDGEHEIPLPVWRLFKRFALAVANADSGPGKPGRAVPDHGPGVSPGRKLTP